MDFQSWISNIEGLAGVYAFDILPDGSFSEIKLMAVNKQNEGLNPQTRRTGILSGHTLPGVLVGCELRGLCLPLRQYGSAALFLRKCPRILAEGILYPDN